MRRHSLVALATFLALLAGAFYVLSRPKEAGMERLDLTALQQAHLDRIELSGARQVVLRHEEKGWVLDNGRAVDGYAIDGALQKLTTLATSDYLGDDAGRYEGWGVAGEHAITLRALAGGATKATLVLGQPQNEAERDIYRPVGHVRRGEQVFAESDGLFGAFDRDPQSWEDKTFVREGEADVASLEVRLHGKPGYAVRRAEAGWQLDEALDGVPAVGPKRFDPQQAAQLVNRLTSSRASRLVDQDPGVTVTGLSEAEADQLAWRVTPEAADRLGHGGASLWLGKAHPEGGVWAKADGQPLPFVVDDATAEGLRREATSFADLTLMANLDVDQVTSFVLEAKPGQQTKFVKVGESWKVARSAGLPKGFVLDPVKLKGRMRQTLLSRALGLAPAMPHNKAVALSQGSGRAILTLADKSEHVLAFGKEASRSGTPVLYAMGTADGQLYLASKPLRDNVLGKLEALGKPIRRDNAAGAQAAAAGAAPQGLDSLPPEVQESIRRQLAGAGAAP